MNKTILLALTATLMTGCGDSETASDESAAAPMTMTPAVADSGTHSSPTGSVTGQAGGSGRQPLDGRPAELHNPDDSTMVFLYFDVAGVTPPIDSWVEQDYRVSQAPGLEKEQMRNVVRQELTAGAAAVQGVGRLRLSLSSANLSDYDPTYGEFTVRALAPNSTIRFSAFRQNVELKFGNGRTAQVWKVPAAEAQLIRDRVSNFRGVQLDALLQIKAVQPGLSGGTLIVDILEFELREARGGTTIGRVQVAGG